MYQNIFGQKLVALPGGYDMTTDRAFSINGKVKLISNQCRSGSRHTKSMHLNPIKSM